MKTIKSQPNYIQKYKSKFGQEDGGITEGAPRKTGLHGSIPC